jgi:Helix-turn-helix domain
VFVGIVFCGRGDDRPSGFSLVGCEVRRRARSEVKGNKAMSVEAMTLVWKYSRHGGTLLLLELALADYADDRGIAWPSIATLAEKIRKSKRYTYMMLQQLEASKEVRIMQRGGGHGSNRYLIALRPSKSVTGEAGLTGEAGFTRRGGPHRRGEAGLTAGVRRASPDSSLTINEPSINPKPAIAGDDDDHFTEPEKAYLTQFGFKKFKTTAQRQRFNEAAAKVGQDAMLKVVAWAAQNGISDMGRIYSAASHWQDNGSGDGKKGAYKPKTFKVFNG